MGRFLLAVSEGAWAAGPVGGEEGGDSDARTMNKQDNKI